MWYHVHDTIILFLINSTSIFSIFRKAQYRRPFPIELIVLIRDDWSILSCFPAMWERPEIVVENRGKFYYIYWINSDEIYLSIRWS